MLEMQMEVLTDRNNHYPIKLEVVPRVGEIVNHRLGYFEVYLVTHHPYNAGITLWVERLDIDQYKIRRKRI